MIGLEAEPVAVARESSDAELYLDAIRGRVVHVLGLLDREPHSRTYGCFDRTFWAWKFTDFPGARFQEGLCALGYLYATPYPESPYHASPRLLRWISAGFDFWCANQRKSGDFDEAYPFERSLAATAFTTFYLCEAWQFLDGELPERTRETFLRALGRAADWLSRNDETHGFLSNHLAAAAGALMHAHRITGVERYEQRAKHFIEKILSHQSTEGWYDEYGGADIGYQTHGSFYLARCLELGADSALQDSLERSFRFLAHFVHTDGSLGGEYASRNTQAYYPAAFEMLATRSGTARWIAQTLRPSVCSLAAAGLGSVDAYNLFPLLNNYVFAHRAMAARGEDGAALEPPSETVGQEHFPGAGLLKVRRGRYEAIVGLGKGGVTKVFDRTKRRLVASDCGWIGRLEGGSIITSQWEDPARRLDIGKDRIVIEGVFVRVSRPTMNPWTFFCFRLVTLTIGRLPGVSSWVKGMLVKVLIYRRNETPIRFVRTISFGEDMVEISDRFHGEAKLESLERGEFFTSIHMGSSRYFVPHELTVAVAAPTDTVHREEIARGVERVRRIALD